MEDAPDSTMALTAALQDLEFLVLADSTFRTNTAPALSSGVRRWFALGPR